jgi:VacB/RNase II family 3'-5' exoribonuclease
MPHFDLIASARQEMIDNGFDPDYPPGTQEQLAAIKARPPFALTGDVHDLRQLLWSSIDNDTSRDLDQAEVAERVSGGIRIRVAVAYVDGDVEKGTPIDRHAAEQTCTVYTGVKNFAMLPDELSTDLTSLNENQDRRAMVVELVVAPDGSITSPSIYRALIRNHAQLAYNGVGAWLEGTGPAPAKVAASADLQAQLKLQDEAAQLLSVKRHECGALDFDRVEAEFIVDNNHQVKDIEERRRNRATMLIEDFMIAANEVMAQTLAKAGLSIIRRVVKTPERWPRIVALAARYHSNLPAEPDSAALNGFLQKMRKADAAHYSDLSLAVIKLMGPGEYVFSRPGAQDQGHFALAVQDYTHSTAPNRRFADLVTQRLIKSVLEKGKPPYSDGELGSIAANCTEKEDAARKVERRMFKRITAVALANRVGSVFNGVITGVTPKGTFVRVIEPPAEGLLIHGEQGVDVGDQMKVKLVSTDPRRGYLDFARIS